MLSLKLIPILWLAVVACNLFVKKFTPELSGWYPAYSGVVAIITLVGILLISCFNDFIEQINFFIQPSVKAYQFIHFTNIYLHKFRSIVGCNSRI